MPVHRHTSIRYTAVMYTMYECTCTKFNVFQISCCLLTDSSLSLAVNAAFIAVSAAFFGIVPEEGIKFARSQLEYVLGEDEHKGRSFMVGFGQDSPQQPRHVGA